MKTKNLFYIIVFLALFTLFSCTKNKDIPKTGHEFAIGNDIQFYFLDASGNDLINLKNSSGLPSLVLNNIEYPVPALGVADTTSFLYYGCSIMYNPGMNLHHWSTAIYGKGGYENNEFYIRFSPDDTDTLSVVFSYKWESASRGDGICPNVDKLYYNGVLVTEGKELPGTPNNYTFKKIIVKKDKGKTIITKGNYTD